VRKPEGTRVLGRFIIKKKGVTDDGGHNLRSMGKIKVKKEI
jgi:hypothetical protein